MDMLQNNAHPFKEILTQHTVSCFLERAPASCSGSRASIVRGPNECPLRRREKKGSRWRWLADSLNVCVLAMTAQFFRLPPTNVVFLPFPPLAEEEIRGKFRRSFREMCPVPDSSIYPARLYRTRKEGRPPPSSSSARVLFLPLSKRNDDET